MTVSLALPTHMRVLDICTLFDQVANGRFVSGLMWPNYETSDQGSARRRRSYGARPGTDTWNKHEAWDETDIAQQLAEVKTWLAIRDALRRLEHQRRLVDACKGVAQRQR